MVTVPAKVTALVEVKEAEIAVILPARETEKASVPVITTIVVPVRGTERVVPNPRVLTVPAKPLSRVSIVTGFIPEAYGIMKPVAVGGVMHAASIPTNGPALHSTFFSDGQLHLQSIELLLQFLHIFTPPFPP